MKKIHSNGNRVGVCVKVFSAKSLEISFSPRKASKSLCLALWVSVANTRSARQLEGLKKGERRGELTIYTAVVYGLYPSLSPAPWLLLLRL